MDIRLGNIFPTSVSRGSAAAISAVALVCAAAVPAAAMPVISLPPVLGGPVFSATATSIPVGDSPEAVATGDLNGDGRVDIATANEGSRNVSLLLNDGGSHFTQKLVGPTGMSPNAIAVGDLRGDGHGSDVAVTNGQSNSMSLFLRDASNPRAPAKSTKDGLRAA